MRTVLAAAAAGALVLGSAGGAIADPGKAKGPKASASAEMTKLQNVNIKRHKKIDLADVKAENVTFNLRAKVRYMKKTEMTDTLSSFGVDLAFFDKKVNRANTGEDVVKAASGDVRLKTTKTTKNKFYAGSTAEISMEALETAVVDGAGKAYLCISGVTVPEDFKFDKFSQQTRMRLGENANGDTLKKTVRDCVKIVNSATDSTSDVETTS